MFRVRNEQIAVLARHHTANNLVADLAEYGFAAEMTENAAEVLFRDPLLQQGVIGIDEHGRIDRQGTPLGRSFTFEYDKTHRLTALTNPRGLRASLGHGDDGLISEIAWSTGHRWTFDYDAWRNLSEVTYPDKTSISMTYSGPERLLAYRDRADQSFKFHRDQLGLVTAFEDATGRRTRYRYEQWNRPTTIIQANGAREDLVRDARGRLVESHVNELPWVRVEYDEAGRVSANRYADGHFVSFLYNDAGNIIEARNPHTVVQREYDDKGRIIAENQAGAVVRFGYDPAGQLRTLTTPNGERVLYDYDPDGRPARVEEWDGGIHTFEYEANGESALHTRPNRISTLTRFDLHGLPQEISSRRSSLSPALALSFEYTPADQIVRMTDSQAGTLQFGYDLEGRLLSVEDPRGAFRERFEYDVNGNRTAVNGNSVSTDLVNQITQHGQTKCVHDARGNLVETSGPEGTTQYHYNCQNLLTSVDLPNGVKVAYFYDPFARRIAKRVGGVTTRYFWAGDQLIGEITEGTESAESRDYLYLPNSFTPLAMRHNGVVYHYHTDGKGTPRWLTDSSGHIVWSAVISGFGECVYRVSEVRQPLRFPGHYHDDETQFQYNRARYYSPAFGRYLSRDPLDLMVGVNHYLYCGNDPVNRTDPFGLVDWGKVALGVGAAVVGAVVIAVALPIVAAAVVGSATVAVGIAAGAAVIGAGALIGGGVALAMAPDGCKECQQKAFLHGALAGAGIAAALLLIVVSAGTAGPGLALAGYGAAGTGAAASIMASADAIVFGAAAAGAAASGGGGGGGQGDGDSGGESKKAQKRKDSEASSKEDAVQQAKQKAGDTGQSDWTEIKDPETGEVIGRRSPNGKQEWRVDPAHKDLPPSEPASQRPHVNWKDWSQGKQNGSYGHVFF